MPKTKKRKSVIELGDDAARERKAKTITAELLRDAGLTAKMLDLHDYLIAHEGWHTSEDLAEHFEVTKHTLFRWAGVLVEKGLVTREESLGDEEEGGRLPAMLQANRAKSRKPLSEDFAKRAEAIVSSWTLGRELAQKAGSSCDGEQLRERAAQVPAGPPVAQGHVHADRQDPHGAGA